jgi:hypothetical protein
MRRYPIPNRIVKQTRDEAKRLEWFLMRADECNAPHIAESYRKLAASLAEMSMRHAVENWKLYANS